MTVFYDGACPLCSHEIAFYRGLNGAEAIRWVDATRCDAAAFPGGVSRGAALARFHATLPDGRVVTGARAFLAVWSRLPRFVALARIGSVPPVPTFLEWGYRLSLRVRPLLQRFAAARTAAPAWLVRELRSDHAGETGAVWIYRGILACTRDPALTEFAARHLETESEHLRLIEGVLSPRDRSWLLPAWRAAGFVTGALPALTGRNATFATIQAVETFVDRHYHAQIDRLDPAGPHAELRALLERCRLDECAHRDDAASRLGASPGPVLRLWTGLVGRGSAAAVVLARRL
jgi:demethoxyubiquinone hydroxylase (CLK1/Coq7/Cat5 family)/predicted DCC family thiol-disulfide oxidoreductase YuxK